MADTLGDLVSEIVDETRRSMSSQISNCILDAIAHYETERFWFNEFSGSFSLSSSQATYTSADASFIPNVMEIDTLRITVDSNYVPVLRKGSAAQFREYSNPNTFAQPTAYAYWGQSIIVVPISTRGQPTRFAAFCCGECRDRTNTWRHSGCHCRTSRPVNRPR